MASDDFNRADSGTLGGNWTVSTGSGMEYKIVSSQAVNTASGASCLESYTAISAPADQSSQVTLKTITAASDEGPGPAVRIDTTAITGYFAQANTTEIRLFKVVNNSFTQLGSDGAAAAANDVLYLEIIGTTLLLKKNGTAICGTPLTDAAIGSGNWGIWCSTNGAIGSQKIDDWVGASASGGPSAGSDTLVMGESDVVRPVSVTLSIQESG